MYEATALFLIVFILGAGYVRYQTTDRKVLPTSGYTYKPSVKDWLMAFWLSLPFALLIIAILALLTD